MIGLVASVAENVGISVSSCRTIARGAYRRYKRYAIPKRDGGLRLVAQPAREVKALQRAICLLLETKLPIHDCATAYKKGASILSNASAHRDAKFLTKMDFSSFFPSIGAEAISRLLRDRVTGISDAEINFIVDACTWRPSGRPELCIGAPSSPFLSNAIMFEFDERISSGLNIIGVSYTRYSDDISISSTSPNVLQDAEALIRRAVSSHSYPRLQFNERKRVAVGRARAMMVTGLTLANNGEVTVGRERKRGVRAGINRYCSGKLDEEQIIRLKGEIAFVLSVEPSFRTLIINTYGVRAMALLPRMRI